MVGGDLSRVVFVSYGHPALRADGSPCGGGQTGFDVHPSFKLDGERLRQVSGFVSARFLPQIKAIAQCAAGAGCANPATDRFTFVDAHQQAFAGRGVCARSEQDPEFDRACFLADGKSFAASPVEGATEPLTCGQPVAEFRAYAPRARWIRTANDSYFVAMTLSGRVAADAAAERHPRRDLGRHQRGLWRRRAPDRRRPCRDGGRGARGVAQRARARHARDGER